MRQLTIDPEFRDKIPPLSEDEFQKLEQNILEDGEVREPIVVWHNTIIDGHHRWKIIQKHNLTNYMIKQMDFPDKWAAIVWMCRNQLGRRNLTDEQRTYLIGKQYEAQKMTVGAPAGNENAKKQLDQKEPIVFRSTAEKVAADVGVAEPTVKRSAWFAKGLDDAEKSSPGIKDAVLSGTVKVPKIVISEIRNVPEEKRLAAVEAIKSGDTETAKAIIRESKPVPPKKEEPEPAPFTPEELGELIDAAAKALDFSLKQHLVLVHRDVLDTKSGRDAAKKSLDDVLAVTQKYLDMIRRIEESAEEN